MDCSLSFESNWLNSRPNRFVSVDCLAQVEIDLGNRLLESIRILIYALDYEFQFLKK
jgi:hypothetical protein